MPKGKFRYFQVNSVVPTFCYFTTWTIKTQQTYITPQVSRMDELPTHVPHSQMGLKSYIG